MTEHTLGTTAPAQSVEGRGDGQQGQPTVFLATPIGVGVRYLFQTDIIRSLLDSGVRVVALAPSPEELRADLDPSLGPLIIERLVTPADEALHGGKRSSRLAALRASSFEYLRLLGMSNRMNLAVINGMRPWETLRRRQGKMRPLVPALRGAVALMQRSHTARRLFLRYRDSLPTPAYHTDLFARYRPDLVVVSSPGWWPGDEVLVREARAHGVPSLALIVGWDHTSSKGLPGARPDRIRAWSQVQKRELVDGSDLDPATIDVGGVAHFDSYHRPGFALSRDDYFARHSLDPSRRLVTFGCSFVGMSSNVGIVRALAEAVANDRLAAPAQLLVRLHPTHMKKPVNQYEEIVREVGAYEEMARTYPHLHLDYPSVASQETPNLTRREDMVALASLLRHSDVFVTLFSTMVLEAAVNDTPTVSVALPPPPEWRWKHGFPITDALDWPTHQRIIASGASRMALSEEAMVEAVSGYLRDRGRDADARRRFALQECTFLDDRSGARIAAYIAHMATGRALEFSRR